MQPHGSIRSCIGWCMGWCMQQGRLAHAAAWRLHNQQCGMGWRMRQGDLVHAAAWQRRLHQRVAWSGALRAVSPDACSCTAAASKAGRCMCAWNCMAAACTTGVVHGAVYAAEGCGACSCMAPSPASFQWDYRRHRSGRASSACVVAWHGTISRIRWERHGAAASPAVSAAVALTNDGVAVGRLLAAAPRAFSAGMPVSVVSNWLPCRQQTIQGACVSCRFSAPPRSAP